MMSTPDSTSDEPPFDLVNSDRSPQWPRYRLRADGWADALIVTELDHRDATLIREDGTAPTAFESISPQRLARLTGEPGISVPSSPGVARVSLPPHTTMSYRIAHGTDLATADPFNRDGAGELASLLTHPDAPRYGLAGLELWPPRVPGADAAGRRQRLRLDREVLGRRATLHVAMPQAHPGTPAVPVVLLLDGDDWIHMYDAMTAFATAEALGALPAHVLVFVPAPARENDRVHELTSGTLPAAITSEVLAAVEDLMASHGLRRGYTVIAGQSLGGLAALRTVTPGGIPTHHAASNSAHTPKAPTARGIDAVVAASPSFFWPAYSDTDPLGGPDGGVIRTEITGSVDPVSLHNISFRFTVGEQEPAMHRHIEAIAAALADAGATARLRRVPGGHDHAVWRMTLVEEVAEALSNAPA